MAYRRSRRRSTAGQALIETCLVMIVVCLILFGLFQLSQLAASREVLDYAAVAGARARAVGFNDFMVHKVVRAAAIPNAGELLEPEIDRDPAEAARWGTERPGDLWDYALRAQPVSPQYAAESSRIPLYLGAEDWSWLPGILDYEDWDTVDHTLTEYPGVELVTSRASQETPLRFPMHRAFYDADSVRLRSGNDRNGDDVILDSHYSLYLDDGT